MLQKLLDPSRICALRETFEEAGVLLMAGHGTELAPQLPALRKQCNDDATNFRQMVATCVAHGVARVGTGVARWTVAV